MSKIHIRQVAFTSMKLHSWSENRGGQTEDFEGESWVDMWRGQISNAALRHVTFI